MSSKKEVSSKELSHVALVALVASSLLGGGALGYNVAKSSNTALIQRTAAVSPAAASTATTVTVGKAPAP